MKYTQIVSTVILSVSLFACVPAKKYNELVEREKKCSEELEQFKSSSLKNEALSKELNARLQVLNTDVNQLKSDTTRLGNSYRYLQTEYDKMVMQNMTYERKLEDERKQGAKETSALQADLDAKNLELQRKGDVLNQLEMELNAKQLLLADREKRVNELEEAIQRRDDAMKALQTKVANALRGFENKGLTVVERDGKVYVSLEAKLLFKSGSTVVEQEGKNAIIQLAKALESEKDLEVIVEGHTDSDKLVSGSHPRSNWELSVLRATAVVEIMTSNSKVNPAILSASGRSEFHPVDANDKAKNRRIEVIISPNLQALFEIINK